MGTVAIWIFVVGSSRVGVLRRWPAKKPSHRPPPAGSSLLEETQEIAGAAKIDDARNATGISRIAAIPFQLRNIARSAQQGDQVAAG